MRNEITNYLEENYYDYPHLLLADGFEQAFVGVVEGMGFAPKACYDKWKCYDILMERDGMSFEEATEYFEFNVAGAYAGEHTPAFIDNFVMPICRILKENEKD